MDALAKANAMLRKFAEFGYLNMSSKPAPENDIHGCGAGCLHCEAFKVLRETTER